jgi:hypothetical protein
VVAALYDDSLSPHGSLGLVLMVGRDQAGVEGLFRQVRGRAHPRLTFTAVTI